MRTAALLGIVLAGCTYQGAQEISGTLFVGGRPLPKGEVRLIAGENPNCAKPSASAHVNDGLFALHRTVSYGRLYVIVQQDALCISEGAGWVMAWQGLYGPASERLVFACQRNGSDPWSCKGNGMESNVR